MKDDHSLDLICLGRVAVDLYGQQIGSRLEDMSGFAKYLGGSSGNVAYGAARLGLRSAMLSRVGNEHMGRFVREELASAGVDTSHLITDPDRLTGLVILGLKDKETFPLIFYRENCADMAISTSDFDEDFIASAQALAITGTHLSTEQTRGVSQQALEYARNNNVRRILDIDYRPTLWGLTTKGDGKTRFIADDEVTRRLQALLGEFDLIVGTEEEFHIAGGADDTIRALRQVRRLTDAVLVCKRGPLGCSVFEDDIPDDLDNGITVEGVKVEVLNVLGAGDAFMAGLLRGYLRDESWQTSCRYANACGALVVSRHGCAPAMPTAVELDDYLQRADEINHLETDDRLNRLHRVTTRKNSWGDLCILAFDHRKQFVEMAQTAGVDIDHIPYLKDLILKAVQKSVKQADLKGSSSGVLADGRFAQTTLNELTGQGWWIARPVELPGSRPLAFENGSDIACELTHWPIEHIVKCLVFYSPDDPPQLRLQQEEQLKSLYRTCCAGGHELLLEVILPSNKIDAERQPGEELTRSQVSAPCNVRDEEYLRVVKRIYNLGIYPDWWKLPPQKAQGWKALEQLIHQRDPHCRGMLVLGLGAPLDELAIQFAEARDIPSVRGFAVGRSIFNHPSKQWLHNQLNDEQFINVVADNYLSLINIWCQAKHGGAA